MNSTQDNGGKGQPAGEDLGRIATAYAQLGAEEPPELLDLAIRNAARRAVEKKPRRMKFGWLHGLTTAAVFVLALSVIIHQRENQPAVGEGLWQEQPQPPKVASPVKKQSSEVPSGQIQQKAEKAAAAATELAAPAAPSPVRNEVLGDAVRESRQKVSAAAVQPTTADDTDEERAILAEAIEVQETDKPAQEDMAARTDDAGQAMAAKAAAVSAPPPAEAEVPADVDAQAIRQLQAIIDMKRDGDENWKAELQTFIENHPGYPLPDELKD